MTIDNPEAQVPETVSSGTVPAEGTTNTPETPAVPAPPQYLTKAEAAQLIADAVKQAKEAGRREMQSEKDKDVRDAIREANRAKRELEGVHVSINDLEPEIREKVELNRYRTREKTQQQLDAEENQRRAFEETINQFKSTLTEYATDVGLDPSDKRLIWGDEAESLTLRQKNFLKSVAAIQKENKKAEKDSIDKQFKETEARLRKELGLDSVENTPPSIPKNNNASQAYDDYIDGKINYSEAVKRGAKFT